MRELRVLIVEDEALVAAELEWLVVDGGHQAVGSAAAGDEARDLSSSLRPDLALVDVNLLDGPTGVEAARAMVASGVHVIFMTANPKQVPTDFPGALGILAKPYTPSAVMQALAYAMGCLESQLGAVERPLLLRACGSFASA